jgi:methionyl aminopeptidase
MKIKTRAEIELLREGGRRLAAILHALAATAKPGVSGLELDALAQQLIKQGGDEAAFLNYQPEGAPTPYPNALCVSVNNEVVHGIPNNKPLQLGDVASLDLGLKHEGLYTDMAVTLVVGGNEARPKAAELIRATQAALAAGVAVAKAGGYIGDIGAAINKAAKKGGYGLVTELGGHGVGYAVHEEPMIPNRAKVGEGELLQPGMVLAIEPMLTLGRGAVKFMPDGYLVKTADGSLAAHCEQTILVTTGEPEILTI